MEELKYGWTDADGTQHGGLNAATALPGVANAWPYPIENRINMLATGIKTPVGIKIMGPDLQVLGDLAERTANAVRNRSPARPAPTPSAPSAATTSTSTSIATRSRATA